MVRALLDGRKTQTRRLATSPLRRCEVGDRLYVRENWRVSPEACEGWHPEVMRGWIDYQAGGSLEVLAPTFDHVVRATFLKTEDHDWDFIPHRYRPCIHMPRWASRLTLIVEALRIERLQAISEADAIAEGAAEHNCEGPHRGPTATYWTLADPASALSIKRTDPIAAYKALWGELHGEESWAANPDVLALTFRVVRSNIDAPMTEDPHRAGAVATDGGNRTGYTPPVAEKAHRANSVNKSSMETRDVR